VPITAYSCWIRWTCPLADWILVPQRRVIPLLGMMDVHAIVGAALSV
jgi:hypothetical protein